MLLLVFTGQSWHSISLIVQNLDPRQREGWGKDDERSSWTSYDSCQGLSRTKPGGISVPWLSHTTFRKLQKKKQAKSMQSQSQSPQLLIIGRELSLFFLKKRNRSNTIKTEWDKKLVYLVTALVQIVTRKQPTTIIHPQPPSGGEECRTFLGVAIAVEVILLFLFLELL